MDATQAAAFIAAVPAARQDRIARDLQVLVAGRDAGSILNPDFQDVKRNLDGAAEGIFKGMTGHFTAGKGGKLDPDFVTNEVLNKMNWDILFMGARTAISARKKLDKIKVSHPMVDAYRAAVAIILPVALLLEEVKPFIVKGRRPAAPEVIAARAARAAKVTPMARATCGCCFGGQAVLDNGYIHDHGYRIPRAWMKTASCPGSSYKPLEVSDAGPRYMVSVLTDAETNLVQEIAEVTVAETLTYTKRKEAVTLVKGVDLAFEAEKATKLSHLELDLRFVRQDLAKFRSVVANWKPVAK
jgi:hypothetical protein